MDYKELMENLEEWHRTICKMCGDDILTCDDLCGCTGDCIVVQAITAITDLLTENQALRNAANGFKKQFEAAESRAEKAERERDASINMLRKIEWCNGCKNFRGLQGCRIGALVTCNPQNDMYVFEEGEGFIVPGEVFRWKMLDGPLSMRLF